MKTRVREWSSVDSKPSGGLVRGVKVLGRRSTNGRRYTAKAIEQAARLCEGAVVFIDHDTRHKDGKPKPRPFLDRFGKLVNVKAGPDGVFGDLSYNPAHTHARTFEGWLEMGGGGVGLSLDALCQTVRAGDGGEDVTGVVAVHSVDLVAVPATTTNLFEGSMTTRTREAASWHESIADAIRAAALEAGLDPKARRKKVLALLAVIEGEGGEVSTEGTDTDGTGKRGPADDATPDLEQALTPESLMAAIREPDVIIRPVGREAGKRYGVPVKGYKPGLTVGGLMERIVG